MRISRLGPQPVPDVTVPADWYLEAALALVVLVFAGACVFAGCAYHTLGRRV